MRRQIVKILKIILIVILLFIAALISGTLILKDRLIRMGVNALNDQLVVPVQVAEIDFSLMRSFPYATMVLNNVVILSPETLNRDDFGQPYADTLLYIHQLSLSFNIRKILDNQLELKAVQLNQGRINILVDDDGSDNFHILKPVKADSNAVQKNMQIMLNELEIKQTRLVYFNAFKNTGGEFNIPGLIVKGHFEGSQYEATTRGNMNLNWIKANQVKIVPLAPTQLQLKLSINNNTLNIDEGLLTSKGLNFDITGQAGLVAPANVNFVIKGKKIEIAGLLQYFSMIRQNKPLNITSTGLLDFETKITGSFSNKQTPLITARFGVTNSTVDYRDLKLKFNQVSLKGGFNNGAGSKGTKARLAISHFECRSAQSNFNGNLMIENFRQPHINSSIQFSGNLDEWNNLIFTDGQKVSGMVEGNLDLGGLVDFSQPFTTQSWLQLSPKANIQLKQANYSYPKKINLVNLIGTLNLDGDQLKCDKITGQWDKTNLSYNGTIQNLLTSFDKPYPTMHINGSLIADKLDYKQLAPFFESTSTGSSNFKYDVNGSIFLNQYTDADFTAENISASVQYANDILTARNLNLYTSEGRINTNLVFKPDGKNYLLTADATVDNLDIQHLFNTFKNFGQKYVTDQNIAGKITSKFTLSLPYLKNGPDWPNMGFLGHVKIVDGKLNDIETTRELASFTKIDDFNHLEFSTLENDLLIRDGKVSFSKMEILSNACDVTLYGQYQFNGDYEYHFTIILTDFMRGKAKRIRQEVTPYGIVENDGLGHTTLYLVATSTNGKTKIRFDRQEMKQHFKDEMQQQKQEVKSILKKEFGLFKNDSTITPDKKDKQPKKQFEIEWESE